MKDKSTFRQGCLSTLMGILPWIQGTLALERMQPVGTIMKGATSFSRGIPPSVVENAIKFGKISPGNSTAEVVRTFENVRVITNPTGTRVISVFKIGN